MDNTYLLQDDRDNLLKLLCRSLAYVVQARNVIEDALIQYETMNGYPVNKLLSIHGHIEESRDVLKEAVTYLALFNPHYETTER